MNISSTDKLPVYLFEPFQAVNKVEENEAERHKKLLDLGESILYYISGILLGEYKKTRDMNIDIESEFYKHSKRMPSLGVFQGFVRLLIQSQLNSILMEKFDKDVIYEHSAELVFSYELLKKVIDEGTDFGFEEKIRPIRKQRSVKAVGLLGFFDCFVQIRNIYAHPEQKAGPKNNKRKWPLNEDYFYYINEKLHEAFQEILECLDILVNYPAGSTVEIIDEKKQAKLLIEQGFKRKVVLVNLNDEQLKAMLLEERYLLDSNGNIYSRLFYHNIPALNPIIATEVIAKEKQAQILPHLKQLIRDKLSDDHRIDAIEYMVLWDTARLAFFTEAELFELIDDIRKELKIDAELGTPKQKGTLFIEKHEGIKRLSFSPYWLKHFLWLQKISLDYQKEEKEVDKKFDSKIDGIKNDLKNLPGNDKIIKAEEGIRSLKVKLKEIKSKQREIPATFREKLKSAQSEERKNALNEERTALEERLQLQIDKYEQEKQELQARIEELKNKQADRKDELIKKLERL